MPRTFHQLATVTFQDDARKAYMEALDHRLGSESSDGTYRVAPFDAVADVGLHIEILEEARNWCAQMDRVSQTPAARDGTDPVRLLARGGNRVQA